MNEKIDKYDKIDKNDKKNNKIKLRKPDMIF